MNRREQLLQEAREYLGQLSTRQLSEYVAACRGQQSGTGSEPSEASEPLIYGWTRQAITEAAQRRRRRLARGSR